MKIEREHGSWPPMSAKQCDQIRSTIETALRPFENHLRRPKRSMAKPCRKRKKTRKMERKNQTETDSACKKSVESPLVNARAFLTAHLLKRHFRFGLNTLTRLIEKNAEFHFVLVFPNSTQSGDDKMDKSNLNQFNLLTKHLRVMCANLKLPAGSFDPKFPSLFLSKLLNMNRIGSFGLLKSSVPNEERLEQELSRIDEKLIRINQNNPKLVDFYRANKSDLIDDVKSRLDEIGSSVAMLLPKLDENSKFEKFLNLETKSTSILDAKKNQEITAAQDSKSKQKKAVEKSIESVIGADFISIMDPTTKKKKQSTRSHSIAFNSRKFIVVDDAEVDSSDNESKENQMMDHESELC